MQVDENIDEGVEISDSLLVAKFRPFNTQSFGLRIDAFRSGALGVKSFIVVRVAVKLITKACPDRSRESRDTAPFRPLLMIDRARLAGGMREK